MNAAQGDNAMKRKSSEYRLLSGLFFKDYGSFRLFFIKKCNRLLIPFLSFYLVLSVLVPNLLHSLWDVSFDTVTGIASLWAFVWPGTFPNVPIWFLFCLFVVNLLFWVLVKVLTCWLRRYQVMAVALVCVLLGIVGLALREHYQFDIAYVFKSCESMPFFCFGYLISRRRGLAYIDGIGQKKTVATILVLMTITFLLSAYKPDASALLYAASFFISGISGALMVLFFAKAFRHVPFVSYLGRYSIILLLTHGVLVRAFAPICRYLSLHIQPDAAIFIVLFLILSSYWVVIPFCVKFLPYVTAQKPLLKER